MSNGPKTIGGVPVDPGCRCEAKNRKGQLCKNPAAVGSHFCPYHADPENPKPTISPKLDRCREHHESGQLDEVRRHAMGLGDEHQDHEE